MLSHFMIELEEFPTPAVASEEGDYNYMVVCFYRLFVTAGLASNGLSLSAVLVINGLSNRQELLPTVYLMQQDLPLMVYLLR